MSAFISALRCFGEQVKLNVLGEAVYSEIVVVGGNNQTTMQSQIFDHFLLTEKSIFVKIKISGEQYCKIE